MNELKGELCPVCNEKKLVLREEELNVPYFGKLYVLSMECAGCGYRKSDIEPAEKKEPCRYTFELETDKDLDVKVIKSGDATVKIPQIMTIDPGVVADGYVTNIEGLLDRVKKMIESSVDGEEDEEMVKKAKVLIKKLSRALAGQEKLKIIIEDPTGHSAILSDKAVKTKL
jgi:zinc finger protein